MNTNEKREMRALIQKLRDEFDVAILLIEHDMSLVFRFAKRITVRPPEGLLELNGEWR